MTRIKNLSRLVPFALALPAFAAPAPAKGPRQELKELTSQLQASPSDQALRERIIALAVKLKPPPAVPEDARRQFMKAVTFQKSASEPGQYELAIQAYRQALLAAPWWGEAYYNLAVALESAGKDAEAIQALQLYLKTKPKEGEARQAQDKIYALEAKAELKMAKAADLSGKWAYESDRAKGEYSFEIYRDGGGYAIRIPPATRAGAGITARTPQLRVHGEGRIGVTLGQDIRWSSGHEATNINEYSLSLSEDGSRLLGTRTNTDPSGNRSTDDIVLYRLAP